MRPRTQLSFKWPDSPFNIVLVEPEIPQNTGNIARLCAATGSVLNLIEPLGFHLTDKAVKRAGLDYWDAVDIRRFPNLGTFNAEFSNHRKVYFSTSGKRNYRAAQFRPGDCLIFGNEGRGLPLDLLEQHSDDVYSIPMRLDNVRSLNLSNAVSIVLYEALQQCND
ncbi:MAG: tRNA (cytidine(34)-2'-O)-methyltransferase [Kiritimatiellales bacterium]